jgi:hypothetical protein
MSVTSFLLAGLAEHHPALVIARPEHLAGIMVTLGQALDISELQASGILVMRDATTLLPTLMRGDMPDPMRLKESMRPTLDALMGSTDRPVRVYGEMADILWQRRRRAAAQILEDSWNTMGFADRFSTLCGYAMSSMYHVQDVDDICESHTHVYMEACGPARM